MVIHILLYITCLTTTEILCGAQSGAHAASRRYCITPSPVARHLPSTPYMFAPTQVGPVADGMVSRGISLTNVRKFCQGLAFVGPAACMIACGLLTPATPGAPVQTWLLVGLLSAGFALGAWSRAGLYCNHQVRRVCVYVGWLCALAGGVSGLMLGTAVLLPQGEVACDGSRVGLGAATCGSPSMRTVHVCRLCCQSCMLLLINKIVSACGRRAQDRDARIVPECR